MFIFVDTYLLAIEVRHDEGNMLYTVSSILTADSLACLAAHCDFVWKYHNYPTFMEGLPECMKHSPPWNISWLVEPEAVLLCLQDSSTGSLITSVLILTLYVKPILMFLFHPCLGIPCGLFPVLSKYRFPSFYAHITQVWFDIIHPP